eukprot:CAMPEP_0170451428 /NCGR_PEP_ID=MMETSP0123-20130129/674_1 /TAXON_ID=182087 /ORGANISM="Favella ehrenbergii, Strain Fehren 1" /LENGTH=191 /DNA_ID=CAMNT_0010713119 /DNA_START=80 /DNA_END=656 /DNA_ORIENTATION=+
MSRGEYLVLDEDTPKERQGLCVTCPAGYECPVMTPIITKPRRCNKGYYSGFGADACIICPAGWSCLTPDVLPVPCPRGKYSSAGATTCLDCPDGAVCKGDGTIAICMPGEVCKASADYAEPIKCKAGKRCPDGKTEADCPTGSYSLEGSSYCTICPKGSRCPNKDHDPIPCGDGTYQDALGKTTCQTCPAN